MFQYLKQADPAICRAIHNETTRQNTHLELIASENFVSLAVLEALGGASLPINMRKVTPVDVITAVVNLWISPRNLLLSGRSNFLGPNT